MYRKFCFRFSLLSLCVFKLTSLSAQVADTGQILTPITSIINNMPKDTNGNDFVPPTASQLNTWSNIMDLLLNGDYSEADDSAAVLDYELVAYFDTTVAPHVTMYMLRATSTNYWGTFILNPSFYRPLVIQSPHPRFDFNTAKEGIYCFRRTNAFFFMMSGTHRCNSSSYSSCDGTTDVCDANEQFRKSDPAHFDSTFFHVATQKLFDAYSGLYFVQLHGFGKKVSDPYVILSNGTRKTPTIDYLDTLMNNLLVEDSTLTFKLVHVDTTWTRQAGLTNTQGRYINGSVDPCGTSATVTNGRFLHVEQEKSKLRNTEAGWLKMSNALTNTFPVGPLPIKLLSFEGWQTDAGNQLKWVTASETNNANFELQRYYLNDWQTIYTTAGAGFSNTIKSYVYVDIKPAMGSNYYRLKQIDFDGRSTISQVISVTGIKGLSEIVIMPNPTSSIVNIEFPKEAKSIVRILDAFGSVMNKAEYQDKSCTLDLTAFKPGIYFIEIQQGLNTYNKKVMKY